MKSDIAVSNVAVSHMSLVIDIIYSMPINYLSQIKQREIVGKTCLLRVDLNIEKGFTKDAFRIQAIIPTIQFLLKNKCKVVIASHRGRPNQQKKALSLDIFAPIIAQKINTEIDFIFAYRIGALVKSVKKSNARVILLENLRFFKGEEKNDPSFARALASCADFYVNDAFPVCHRQNSSVVAITKFLPSYAGLRLEEEIKRLDKVMFRPSVPLTLIIGGAKIANKIEVIKNFWSSSPREADYFLFSSSVNYKVSTAVLRPFLRSPKIKLPVDFKMSGGKPLDIGPKTEKLYSDIIKKSKTIIWNGPMGMFENKKFAQGTIAIWKAVLAKSWKLKAKSYAVIGGGETIASLQLLKPKTYNLKPNIFFSTGGGAMLEYLSGKKLPGIEVLKL